ncbi:hypothetical protein IAT38_002193 [Cryptococcus sp. DSM 104549]
MPADRSTPSQKRIIIPPSRRVSRSPPRQRAKRAEVTMEDDDPGLVGVLSMEQDGVCIKKLMIVLGEVFWIGRHPDCNLVLKNSRISSHHLRIYAVRTSTPLSLAIIHDVSRNGFILNGQVYGKTIMRVGSKALRQRSVVMRDGDTLRLPGSPIVFTYHHSPHHSPSTDINLSLPPALFLFDAPRGDPTTYSAHPWKILNYRMGHGTFGIVNLGAFNSPSGRAGLQVAIKTILVTLSTEHQDRVRREIRILHELDHPNMLGLLDLVKEKATVSGYRRIHLVAECVTGGELWSYIAEYRVLREDEVRWMGWQLVGAMKYLHAKGIAHRDLKPENILLHASAAYPRLIIADFGEATSLADLSVASSSARYKHTVGTLLYLPPERCLAYHFGDKREVEEVKVAQWFKEETMMDAWALGAILYFCATGTHFCDTVDSPRSTVPSQSSPPVAAFKSGTLTKPNQRKSTRESFISLLLEYDLDNRMSMEEGEMHEWFARARAELDEMYDRIIGGEVIRWLK